LIFALISVYIPWSIPYISALGGKPIRFIVTDKYGKPLEGAIVVLQTIDNTYVLPPTDKDGITLSGDFIPSGIYHITVKWKTPYEGEEVIVYSENIKIEEPYIFDLKTQVFPIVIKIITPRGVPLDGTLVYLNGKAIGYTGHDGQIRVDRVTFGTYEVKTTWLGTDVSPGLVDITSEEVEVVVARNIVPIRIRVVGAREQGLPFAEVLITRNNVTLQSFVDDQGILVTELPIGNYTIAAHYKGLGASQNVDLLSEATVILRTAVFMELFGASMTFSTFILWVIMVEIVVILLIIIAQEYNICMRNKLTKLYKQKIIDASRLPLKRTEEHYTEKEKESHELSQYTPKEEKQERILNDPVVQVFGSLLLSLLLSIIINILTPYTQVVAPILGFLLIVYVTWKYKKRKS
jgi:hypothetical protein